MVKEADTYAAKDKERKAGVEARNEAETAIYSAEKSVAEYKDKVEAGVVDAINTNIAAVRATLEGDAPDADKVRAAVKELQAALMKIGEALNKGAAGGGGDGAAGGEAGGAAGGADNTYDADVKDEKK